jgi:hypothetical protein
MVERLTDDRWMRILHIFVEHARELISICSLALATKKSVEDSIPVSCSMSMSLAFAEATVRLLHDTSGSRILSNISTTESTSNSEKTY